MKLALSFLHVVLNKKTGGFCDKEAEKTKQAWPTQMVGD